MSTRKTLIRYSKIINLLKVRPSSFKEINSELERASNEDGENLTISVRTFQRDIHDILSIFGIEIKYDAKQRVYQIDDEQEEVSSRILEAFNLFEVLSSTEKVAHHIHFEKNYNQESEKLKQILNIIQKKKCIAFTYTKYWINDVSDRILEPYAIKEFKNRWYLIGKDLKDNRIKTFGLDRISNITIHNKHFTKPKDFSLQEMFKYSFGIISNTSKHPLETVRLSIDPTQGKYVKSLPLHWTQTVIEDTPQELIIELTVYLTLDFISEILSMGNRVKVLTPKHFQEQIKTEITKSLNRYD